MEHSFYQLPEPFLKHIVKAFWQVERINPIPVTETIIPNGQVEIIFNLQDEPFCSQVGGRMYQLPRCFINGYNTQSIAQQLPHQQTFFGVVLHATAAKRLFRMTAGDFVDCCTDMVLVDSTIASLWYQLAEQPTFTERVKRISDVFAKRLIRINAHEQAFDQFINGFGVVNTFRVNPPR